MAQVWSRRYKSGQRGRKSALRGHNYGQRGHSSVKRGTTLFRGGHRPVSPVSMHLYLRASLAVGLEVEASFNIFNCLYFKASPAAGTRRASFDIFNFLYFGASPAAGTKASFGIARNWQTEMENSESPVTCNQIFSGGMSSGAFGTEAVS